MYGDDIISIVHVIYSDKE